MSLDMTNEIDVELHNSILEMTEHGMNEVFYATKIAEALEMKDEIVAFVEEKNKELEERMKSDSAIDVLTSMIAEINEELNKNVQS